MDDAACHLIGRSLGPEGKDFYDPVNPSFNITVYHVLDLLTFNALTSRGAWITDARQEDFIVAWELCPGQDEK